MSIHFQREISNLKRMILALSARVEESVQQAAIAIESRDNLLAAQIISNDREIDQLEITVEEECLKILALYQPVASDLRFIVAVLKINSDLERIGDHACNIAKRALLICQHPDFKSPVDLSNICASTLDMLRLSLDALMNLDPAQAQKVLTLDDEVDQMDNDIRDRVFAALQADPGKTEVLFSFLAASHCFERIADNTTNIAEDVIYMTEGMIIRHGKLGEDLS